MWRTKKQNTNAMQKVKQPLLKELKTIQNNTEDRADEICFYSMFFVMWMCRYILYS